MEGFCHDAIDTMVEDPLRIHKKQQIFYKKDCSAVRQEI